MNFTLLPIGAIYTRWLNVTLKVMKLGHIYFIALEPRQPTWNDGNPNSGNCMRGGMMQGRREEGEQSIWEATGYWDIYAVKAISSNGLDSNRATLKLSYILERSADVIYLYENILIFSDITTNLHYPFYNSNFDHKTLFYV